MKSGNQMKQTTEWEKKVVKTGNNSYIVGDIPGILMKNRHCQIHIMKLI